VIGRRAPASTVGSAGCTIIATPCLTATKGERVTKQASVDVSADEPDGAPRVERCDVCILGAGIAGINALFVASRYLSRDHKVVLVDRRRRVGGMWIDTYPYVRLHQPHGHFTAGNVAWTLGREREHLASKDEVLDHFQHCLDVLKERIGVVERFGYEYQSHEEMSGGEGSAVRIRCAPASPDEPPLVVEASRFIKAYGVGITPNEPLEVSSAHVHSVSPDRFDVLGEEVRASDAPIYVVGGGKTGMDTAHALIAAFPGREVNLVAGSGTVFSLRDRLFPTGARRWWGGISPNQAMLDAARRFDGTNELEVHDYFRSTYGTSLSPDCQNFLFGALSRGEQEAIAAGLNESLLDHLVDVVDRDGRTELVLRSGATRTIPRGSFIVNCTGYIWQQDLPYEPYVSESGAVVSIQLRSTIHILSSYAAYFLTHLLLLDKLCEVPLYELDLPALRERSKSALPYAAMALAIHNLILIVDSVPSKVMNECGLDLDRWYPLHRRLASLVRFLWNRKRDLAKHRRSLDTVRERFGVRCGPLRPASRPAAP
jgi:hypothetical protein